MPRAWMLLEMVLNLDYLAYALAAAKSGAGALGGYLFKKGWGKFMATVKVCMIKGCGGVGDTIRRGLCTNCFSSAKKLVDSGQTTWEDLAAMGLCEDKNVDNAFYRAYKEKRDEN